MLENLNQKKKKKKKKKENHIWGIRFITFNRLLHDSKTQFDMIVRPSLTYDQHPLCSAGIAI